MKIEVYVSSGFVGATSKQVVEIDDEELEGMSDRERDSYIEKFAQEVMFNMIEWGWDPVES